MKIKTRLQLSTLLSVAIAIVIGLILFFTAWNVGEALEKNRTSNEIIKAVFELNIVTNNYILEHEERSQLEWNEKDQYLKMLLQQRSFNQANELVIINQLFQEHQSMKDIFSRLVLIQQKEPLHHRMPSLSEEKLISLLLIKSQVIVANAFKLSKISYKRVTDIHNRATVFIMGFFILIVIIMSLNYYLFNLSIIKPISRLRQETEIIGEGNLDYLAASNSEDEIGDLSRSFNKMTGRLKASTVSRNYLLKEIEERNKVEKTLKELTSQLKYSNEELKQFAYVASHDLQEPLRMVSSYCRLLEKRYHDKLDDNAREFIAFAVDGANRMHQLIEALLSYSRVGTSESKFRKVDCEKVLKSTLDNLQEAIRENNAEIIHDSLPEVFGDETQLSQLFQNLIQNSIKYRGSGPPRIIIKCQPPGIDLEKVDDVHDLANKWLFSLQDNGIGFDAKYSEKVFVIFQRLHTRIEYPGTGIGLAICKKIVERHNGEIWVDSNPENGSTFYFTLPVINAEATNQELQT